MDTVIDGFRTELTRQDKSPATVRNYTNDVELFAKWMNETYGSFDVAKVVQRDIIEYRSHLLTAQSASPATVNRRLASLSKFFGWCMATKLTKTKQNPATGVKTIAVSDPGPRSLDVKSLRRLLREVHVHGTARDIAILEVLAGTATRVGELVLLSVSDAEISERKGILRIRWQGACFQAGSAECGRSSGSERLDCSAANDYEQLSVCRSARGEDDSQWNMARGKEVRRVGWNS